MVCGLSLLLLLLLLLSCSVYLSVIGVIDVLVVVVVVVNIHFLLPTPCCSGFLVFCSCSYLCSSCSCFLVSVSSTLLLVTCPLFSLLLVSFFPVSIFMLLRVASVHCAWCRLMFFFFKS